LHRNQIHCNKITHKSR